MEKDYKNTLNLPKTDLPMKAGLPNKEPEILSFWDSINLYNLIREENAKKDKFILHDGPPYANGDIHLGHSVNKILKDIVIKTKTLQGFDAPYVPGWDCHGLPIELNVEKKFGRDSDTVKDKSKFISACREYALSQIENQKKDFMRLGVLGDWENSYKSLDSSFEADTVRSLGRIVTNGHLQKGEKPVHFCYDCKSALAEAEVEYEDKVSKSIDVGFKVKEDSLTKLSAAFSKEIDSCSFVIWTTTPWTIPANAAVSIGPELKYTLCSSKFGNLILASDLIDQCSERWDEDLEKISEAKGSDIKDVVLEHPYLKRDSILVHGDHVTTETGTGCVHTAPAHGVDDHNICKKFNIETIHALDGNGFFNAEYEGLAGLPAIKADNIVIDILNDSGALINAEDFHHSYPYCWRHKTPLIFASTPQWFISMDKSGLLEGSIQAVKDVEWEPSWGYERIKSMLEGRPDWCISRQRSWGVPIPLIINKKTGEIHPKQNLLFNEIADRIDEQGLEAWDKANLEDLIDDHDEYIKATDTLDVWFDSGSTHFCVLDKLYGKDLIADLYLEGSDQHRGWFQSSLLTGIAINGKAPYKAVLTHGFVVDENGRKQSKSLGNVVSPQKVCNNLGADILRLWVASTDFRSEMVATDEIMKQVADQYRRIRNTFRFMMGNLNDFNDDSKNINQNDLVEIDKWIISAAIKLDEEVKNLNDSYAYHHVVQKIHNFCVHELGGIYLDIIKDRMYVTKSDSHARNSAQFALFEVADILIRLISPILVFTAEEIWQSHDLFKKQSKSVFLCPKKSLNKIESSISDDDWKVIFAVKDSVNQNIEKARADSVIKGSLDAKIRISCSSETYGALKKIDNELKFVFIASEVELIEDSNTKLSIDIANYDQKKCIRCWNKCESVGSHENDPEICSRCHTNVYGDGEVRKFV
ncbi:MAG: isoleucine--tRNA ligase [Gammaproteobacteria bacterium]|tara:strand:- start:424 stop:3198 length:2775 start_codon:yes stop_codon:yes gene_type:complete